MTCSLENLVCISFYASEHIFFCENIRFFGKSHKKMLRNSLNYHVIIFYLIYVDHLIEDIFITVSFLTLRTFEKLFFVLSYFRFYEMSFFHWKLMSWEAFIPKYSVFFSGDTQKLSVGQFVGILPDWKMHHSKK